MSRTIPAGSQEPDTNDAPRADGADSTPRDRVVEHLETLLRGATAVGTGVLLGWASRAEAQRPPQVCDPLPPPVSCKAPDHYSVGRCLAQHTQWTRVEGRTAVEFTIWLLQVGQNPWEALPALPAPPPPRMLAPGEPALPVSFARVTMKDVAAKGATVQSVTSAANRVDVSLLPEAGAKTITLSLPSPAAGDERFTVVLDISAAPKAGLLVPVRLADPTR
jgi:hypothetical protein